MDITARGVTGQVWPGLVYGFILCDGENCPYNRGQGISCRDLHPVDITREVAAGAALAFSVVAGAEGEEGEEARFGDTGSGEGGAAGADDTGD